MTAPAVGLGLAVAEAALEGGEIGALGGPAGVVIGVVVGATIVLALAAGGIAIGDRFAKANEKAEKELKPIPADKVCDSCADAIPCFNPPEGATPDQIKEFERQLKEQEEELNKMDPEDLIKNIEKYKKEGRPLADAAARKAAREKAKLVMKQDLTKKFLKQHMTEEQAEKLATEEAEKAMAGKDATHTLDLVAGGDGDISGMGDSSTNRSIGSQWKTRRESLLNSAKGAKSSGKKMNVKLKKC